LLLKSQLREQEQLKDTDSLIVKILKRSVDARNRNIKINLTVLVSINEDILPFRVWCDTRERH